MAKIIDYNALTDLDLAVLLKQGNHQAFTAIFERYSPLLFIHAFNKLNDREKAKDAVQEVFTNIWAKREAITFITNLSGYLYIALRNKILDGLAREKYLKDARVSLQNFLDNPAPSSDYAVREHMLQELIQREIASLPPRMRQVFEMSRHHYLSHKEIAESLNISEETVRDQIKKAIKILRPRIRLVVVIVTIF